MLKKLEKFLIKCYQKSISGICPGKCRLTPSCSSYALIVLTRFGFIKGNFLVLKRLIFCTFSKQKNAVDNVPQNIKGEYKWLI